LKPRRSGPKKSSRRVRRRPLVPVPQPALLANANAFANTGGLLNWLAPKESPKSELNSPTQIVLGAFRYAAVKHRQQTLADGVTPYFAHVVRVCWILRDVFRVSDTATIVASILHDVVEDTNTGIEEIEARFGKTIAQYVDLLTKDAALPKRQRERDYHEKLLNAPETVQIAKLADLYDNLSRRIGTTRLPSTIKNARSLAGIFEPLLTSRRGRAAVGRVQQLISEIESTELGRRARRKA
jgi:(p)ppGpp synthase/HD superfamily hydrolase